ncbi:hypothetical protein GRJ2_000683000 [Grus japonensis]|uniref:Uncharacterized protein n=1 Tax=Grus japonensis TaxID=30415 RepID=A0ABC9WAY2_GRUJA
MTAEPPAQLPATPPADHVPWPPDQEEEVDEAFYRQLEVASRSQALVLMGDFNHPDICWKGNMAHTVQEVPSEHW